MVRSRSDLASGSNKIKVRTASKRGCAIIRIPPKKVVRLAYLVSFHQLTDWEIVDFKLF